MMDAPRWHIFWEPKVGSEPREYEDAFWPPQGRLYGDRFAVADGATESSYSREWADALSSRYGSGATWKTSFLRGLPDLQQDWRRAHTSFARSWYAEQKISQGAFAAFLGVRLIRRGGAFRLHALAIGDCELVHVADDAVHCAFPLTRSGEFGSRPVLIGTGTPLLDARTMARGRREDVCPGDSLLMMTDAIAAWFMRTREAAGTPWRDLLAFEPDDTAGFADWVTHLRTERLMRNDDVTVGVVRIP